MMSLKQIKKQWVSGMHYFRDHKQYVTLAALLLAILIVYGWMFMRGRASVRRSDIPPQVAKVIAGWHGQLPQFPMFRPPAGFHRGDWRKMTIAQRRAMWRQRRIQMEAFFLAFAHANAQEQAAIIAAAKARFAARQAQRQNSGHHGPGHGRGNLASRIPHMMARSLISGNSQMHAAMTGFFMAMRNAGR